MNRPGQTAVVVLLLGCCLGSPGRAFAQGIDRGNCRGAEPQGWSVTVAGEDEPGVRLVVEGRVLEADGTTPVAGAFVHVFQTDDEGYYSPGAIDENDARLCAVLTTDEAGRYRVETIRPGAYPGRRIPAHIHFAAWGPDVRRQAFVLQFADDPLSMAPHSGPVEGSWGRIRPVEVGPNGSARVVRDLKLK